MEKSLVRVLPPVLLSFLAFACIESPTETEPPPNGGEPSTPGFVDRTQEVGLHVPGSQIHPTSEETAIAGGVAAGDIDRDGDIDLFLVSTPTGLNSLFLNDGSGNFEDVAFAFGMAETPQLESGPLFADLDGDGFLDLVVGGVRQIVDRSFIPSVRLFRNESGLGFTDITGGSGLDMPDATDTYSATAGDVTGDGRLDLLLTHWRSNVNEGGTQVESHGDHFLWRNDGGGQFTDITGPAGLTGLEYTFAGNLADIDGDRDLDLLMVSDWGSSRVFRNVGGTFVENTGSVLTDGNGMGASVGDYDNDGDLDWFVSSIWDPNGIAEGDWDTTGNRLYRNDGSGTFTDVSEAAGVREGYWGWGSCFADFDNDGHLDIFHVNGMPGGPAFAEFDADPSVLFMSNGDGTFTESAVELGIDDTGQGRGVSCFDADRDGRLDILIANNGTAPTFYQNDLDNENHWLEVILQGAAPNTQGIGAMVTAEGATVGSLVREIRAGSNFVSQDPAEAHFGLAADALVDLTVAWPDGAVSRLEDVDADQVLVVTHPGATP